MPPTSIAAVIPAWNEERRVAATTRSLRELDPVDLVVVVSDGSRDRTATAASHAGALVVEHKRRRGKGAAMETGADAVGLIDQYEGGPARHLLFADADLEHSAGAMSALIDPVLAGEADMTIARLPPSSIPGGGRGRVVRLSRWGIQRATGYAPLQPLSGQRCMTRETFDLLRPLASGFGVETALTLDALSIGRRVVELDVPLFHRVTEGDWQSRLHRGRQFIDVARALAVRRLRLSQHLPLSTEPVVGYIEQRIR